MEKTGVLIEIPGFGNREVHTVVSDYTGTLSCAGKLVQGVREKLIKVKQLVDIRIISSDSFGTAEDELGEIVKPEILKTDKQDVEKQNYVEKFDLKHLAAFGNGNNDRLMLKTVKDGGGLAVAVDNGEGCALDALLNANLFIVGAVNGLNLLLEPRSCKATLRF